MNDSSSGETEHRGLEIGETPNAINKFIDGVLRKNRGQTASMAELEQFQKGEARRRRKFREAVAIHIHEAAQKYIKQKKVRELGDVDALEILLLAKEMAEEAGDLQTPREAVQRAIGALEDGSQDDQGPPATPIENEERQ